MKSFKEKKTVLKRAAALFVSAAMVFCVFGCGKSQDSPAESEKDETSYKEAVDVLNTVLHAYSEDELFAVAGGDVENAVMDAPGRFDISKTEELDTTLGLPATLAADIEDAASMVHMMNANTFTGAAYRLKDGTDSDAFVDAVKSNILSRQWICGQPDTLLIIQADKSYVITAFGEAEIMKVFKENALSALDGAKVIAEESIE